MHKDAGFKEEIPALICYSLLFYNRLYIFYLKFFGKTYMLENNVRFVFWLDLLDYEQNL